MTYQSYLTFRYLLKLQSEELQIHAAEITDVRKAVEREKLSRKSLMKRTLPHKQKPNRNAKKRYQTYELPNGVIKNTSKNLEEDPLSHPLTDASADSTTELPLIEVDNVTGKSEYMNQARELMVQHKTTLSEVRQLHNKLAESLGEHHDMKRSIDELKTEVS